MALIKVVALDTLSHMHAAFKSNHQLCIWKFGNELSRESRRYFQYGSFKYEYFISLQRRDVSQLSNTLKFFTLSLNQQTSILANLAKKKCCMCTVSLDSVDFHAAQYGIWMG